MAASVPAMCFCALALARSQYERLYRGAAVGADGSGRSRVGDVRTAFVVAAVGWGTLVVAITQGLSLFSALS